MLKSVIVLFILVLNFIVQSAVFPFIEINEVKPDTLMILIVLIAILAGNPLAALSGMFGGLLLDVLYGNNLGLFASLYMLIGYVSALLCRSMSKSMFITALILTAFGMLMKEFVMVLINYLLFYELPFYSNNLIFVLYWIIYTLLFLPFLLIALRRLFACKFMINK